MLAINDERFVKRAEIIWEKGTNRSAFWRGEIDKYGWVDIGSSFLPSEIIAAFLFAQLEHLEQIQKKRKEIWKQYFEALKPFEDKGFFKLPQIQEYASNNGHMFYLICQNEKERNEIIAYLKQNEVNAVFHYLSLHKSPYYKDKHDGRELLNSDMYSVCLVRLPFYYELQSDDINKIVNKLNEYFRLK